MFAGGGALLDALDDLPAGNGARSEPSSQAPGDAVPAAGGGDGPPEEGGDSDAVSAAFGANVDGLELAHLGPLTFFRHVGHARSRVQDTSAL